MPLKSKRVRRQPEDARRLILDAAETRMGAEGPAGLRLQDVAQAAGVSHPTIIHHFGSREGLVRALYLRSLEALKTAVLAQIGHAGDESIKLTFAAYRDGLAQRILWLLQSAPLPAGRLAVFEEIVSSVHETRLRHMPKGHTVDIADTRAVVHLITVAALGDALIGARLRQSTASKEPATGDPFEDWFCALIARHMGKAA
jgi:AcrR family transcriptional regulator